MNAQQIGKQKMPHHHSGRARRQRVIDFPAEFKATIRSPSRVIPSFPASPSLESDAEKQSSWRNDSASNISMSPEPYPTTIRRSSGVYSANLMLLLLANSRLSPQSPNR